MRWHSLDRVGAAYFFPHQVSTAQKDLEFSPSGRDYAPWDGKTQRGPILSFSNNLVCGCKFSFEGYHFLSSFQFSAVNLSLFPRLGQPACGMRDMALGEGVVGTTPGSLLMKCVIQYVHDIKKIVCHLADL